jgi:hypothetical protein
LAHENEIVVQVAPTDESILALTDQVL